MDQPTPPLFLEWRSPRYGTANPSDLTNPVWEWLVRTRKNAYLATHEMEGPSAIDAGPGWCFDRFGQSTTRLPDGREIWIAGEHEDYYDPDFFIYNDVVVIAPEGGVTIYGYPREVFPPTDFHSATLLPHSIVLIGSLGYPGERRPGETQVLQLMLDTFAVETIETSGASPGWIHGHRAVLAADRQSITISAGMVEPLVEGHSLKENIDDWVLSLADWRWTRARDRGWPQWTFRRADHSRSRIWEMRQALWAREVGWEDYLAQTMERLVADTGRKPDLDLLGSLYRPDDSVTSLPPVESEHNVFRVVVDGTVARFTEEGFIIRAIVEGQISPERLRGLQTSVLEKLSKLEGEDWELESL